jgi:hypothetical protein
MKKQWIHYESIVFSNRYKQNMIKDFDYQE